MWFRKKRIRSKHIDQTTKKLTKYVMTLKDENGNDIDLYEFETIHDMPAARYMDFNDFIEDHTRGITKQDLIHNLKEAISDLETGDYWIVTGKQIHKGLYRCHSHPLES